MQRKMARWLIEHDPEVTRRCYGQLPAGSGCTCNQCRNFDAAAGRTFPREFVELAHSSRGGPTKPAELCHYDVEPSGLYLTTGWFHFVGEILTGEDVVDRSEGYGTFRFEELAPGLEFGFTTRLALVGEVFAGLPVVQLEFQTRLPWVLAEPAPDAS